MLEIGCGWGGFAERAAADAHRVTGLTISPAQHAFATNRLKDSAEIRLEDYRKCKGQLDNIVSIEMFEAVGEHYWPAYFATVAERLERGARQAGAAGFDGLIIAPGPDLAYFADYLPVTTERITMLVIPADGEPTMLVPALEHGGAAGTRARPVSAQPRPGRTGYRRVPGRDQGSSSSASSGAWSDICFQGEPCNTRAVRTAKPR